MRQNKYSDYKIFSFPEKVESFRTRTLTAPVYVRIKPTNRCNHACRFCTYSDGTTRPKDRPDLHLQSAMHTEMREQDVMPTWKLMEMMDDLRGMNVQAVTFSGGGEPLFHPAITQAMTSTLSSGIDLSIITNGQLLTGERAEILTQAKWVRVSIDYTSAEQMHQSRAVPTASFDAVLKNMRQFAAAKTATCDLGVNFIVTRYNYEGITSFARTLKDCGVENVRFSPVYVQGFRDYHKDIAVRVREQLSECQALVDDTFSVNSTYDLDSPGKSLVRPFHRCLYAQTVCVAAADLNIYACHNTAYSAHGRIASFRDQSFRQAWFSTEAREWHAKFNPGVACLHECANHNKVALFESLASDSHDAFV